MILTQFPICTSDCTRKKSFQKDLVVWVVEGYEHPCLLGMILKLQCSGFLQLPGTKGLMLELRKCLLWVNKWEGEGMEEVSPRDGGWSEGRLPDTFRSLASEPHSFPELL